MNEFVTMAAWTPDRPGSGPHSGGNQTPSRYRFADLELDLGRRQVWRDGTPIRLTKLTFNLLVALVERAPNLVPRDELAALAWGHGRVVTPEAIAQRMMVLRRSLGESARAPRYIEGRRGEGYRLLPEVRSVGLPSYPPPVTSSGALLGADDSRSEHEVPIPSRRLQARALYLQALSLWSTNDHARSIRAILERAVYIDPNFAPAYGLLAYLDATSFIDTINAPAVDHCLQQDLERRVRSNAAAGLALDADLGPAHAALAGLDMHTWHWQAARRGFDRGGNPGWANDTAPWFYCWIGDPGTGVARARHNVSQHPTSWICHRDLGITLAYAGARTLAWQSLERSAEMAPANVVTLAWLAYLAAREDRARETRGRLERVEALFDTRMPMVLLPELACAYGRIGDFSRAAQLFDEIAAHECERVVGCGTWAAAHVAVRDKSGALDWLDRAAEKIARHEPDSGFLSLMNLRMNFLDDPWLEQPAVVRALDRLRGA